MTTWDAAFEASPADADEYKYGANKIRELKTAISERLEQEMNFKTGTQPLIKAGIASVCYAGNTTDIANLANMSANAFSWDTTLKVFKRYSGANWAILDIDHGQLSGMTDDDHPRYLSVNKANQSILANVSCAANVTIDGVDISAHAAASAMAAHANNIGVHTHANTANQGGLITNIQRLLVHQYTGDGVDDREVDVALDLANAANVVVMVKNVSDTDRAVVFRTSNDVTTTAHYMTAAASASNLIKSFTANGFTLGTAYNVNRLAHSYIAMIWYQTT